MSFVSVILNTHQQPAEHGFLQVYLLRFFFTINRFQGERILVLQVKVSTFYFSVIIQTYL